MSGLCDFDVFRREHEVSEVDLFLRLTLLSAGSAVIHLGATRISYRYLRNISDRIWQTRGFCGIFLVISKLTRGRCVPGSSVGIATDYGLDGPGSNPDGDEIFRPSRPALWPTQPPVKWVPSLSRG